ncbi:cellulose biosynthesis cyclic di-GMP-binding regulatory protein BcsB [Microvirga sp. GCM10011540]|uniref:cellulose biosynthesis cyclic di-GMP-binding regulatory protein BcsB n=1 Tax=Microvirga sp. GCM10011540 TaxID=3317338 RepID=UPI0036124F74
MRAHLIPLLAMFGLLGAGPAFAQAAPFTMSPTRPGAPPVSSPAAPAAPPREEAPAAAPFSMQPGGVAPARPPVPRPAAPASSTPAAPFDIAPQDTRQSPPPQAGRPTPPAVRPQGAIQTAPATTQASAPRNTARLERPLLPFEMIRLDGENDSRSWAFHLTPDEAASRASIAIAYQNAVVVMPEASRLRAIINGEAVVNVPISSSQGFQQIVLPIRPGLLRGGQNIIRLEALQRHRTDCTVRATYELWTDISAEATKLVFEGSSKTLRSLEDLPAVGIDQKGVTTIRVVAPKIYRPEIRDRLLRLVQMVALRGRYAHPVIQVFEADPGPSPVGTIKVVMGTAGELRSLVAALPEAAAVQPLAIMMQDGTSSMPSLVVTGPTWNDLDTAINIVGGAAFNGRVLDRTTIDTASWHWPEVPTTLGRRSIRFADMGIPTQEFSGRRFRARFAINLPSDFYATDYGEATLSLDAAHTSMVKPGSHFDIYVNGKIASTMTITSRGSVFRRQEIRVPMRNFEAGINHLSLEAVLLTDADERCAPGETLSEMNRFVLFDSTSLNIPNFGRIGREPDLAALSSGGFPYGDFPATFVLARPDPLTYSASGTLLARMARDSGAPVRAQFANAASLSDRSVVFVGAIDQLPAGLLDRVNVSENLRMIWQSTPSPGRLAPSGAAESRSESQGLQVASTQYDPTMSRMVLDQSDMNSTDEVRRRWSESIQRRGIIQQTIASFKDWMERTFNLSLASLSLEDKGSLAYEPPQRSTLLLAQNRTEGAGTWTLVTARTEESLAQETARLAAPMLWSQVAGRAAALEPSEEKLAVQPIDDFIFVQTLPLSFWNLRLVAANWMSINILQYALLMVACCTLLGAATYVLLSRLGRRS